MRPKVCVLRTDGTNCDAETKYAFELAGGEVCLVHINQLIDGRERLENYEILTIPGGFSYGDDLGPGKILAVELISCLKGQLEEFAASGKLILGIGNGFQVLLKTGLLPGGKIGRLEATLMENEYGDFECRWVDLAVGEGNCIFTKGMGEKIVKMPLAHGQGKFYAAGDMPDILEGSGRVVFRYVDERGKPTMGYPCNPNGSVNSIAGICDATGRILGLMPHPERFVSIEQYPNWRRKGNMVPHGRFIFENAVKYAVSCK